MMKKHRLAIDLAMIAALLLVGWYIGPTQTPLQRLIKMYETAGAHP